jgi:hypothetical protein
VSALRAILWFLLILMALPLSTGAAQAVRPDTTRRADTLADSARVLVTGDTLAPPVRSKSPTTAMLLSGILPGAGQVYNESYWKTPIILGLGLYFVSEWLNNNRHAEDYRQQYDLSLQALPPYGNTRLRDLREFYKDQRDSFTWYYFILYVLNIVDAYVDASLYGFDVSPALSLRGLPTHGLTVRFTW